MDAWLEDFRDDIKEIKVPTLVTHGDADRILPIEATGARMAKLVPGAKYHVIKDGPHGCNWTHATEFNEALLKFLEGKVTNSNKEEPGDCRALVLLCRCYAVSAATPVTRIKPK